MSALVPWLAVAVPWAAALGIGLARRGAAWAVLVAAGATLALVAAAPAGDALGGALAGLAAAATLLAVRPGMAPEAAARLLVMLGALALAAFAPGALAWVGIAVAGLAPLLRAPLPVAAGWRALRVLVPALGLALAGLSIGGDTPGRLSLSYALLVAGLAGCAGLAPLQDWRRAAGSGPGAALLPVLTAAALVLLLRARTGIAHAADALDPAPPLLLLGLASLGWASWALWRRPAGVVRDAGLFHAGLACCAFGLGGPQADAAGMLLLAGAALALAALPDSGQGRAGLLALLALLPPFAPFGAGMSVLAAATDVSLVLAAVLAGLATAGAAGLGRAALRAGSGPVTLPAAAVLVLGLLAGVVPAVTVWFDTLAGVVR